jgi:hemerythrin-like metal-binding protein
MPLLTWNKDYSVKIQEIDVQHQKLVELINELHDGMKIGKGKEIIGKILNELVNYTAFHFQTEEKLFDKYGYPDKIVHKRQHGDLVEQVMSFKKSFDEGKGVVTVDLMNFLKDWLTNHINNSDKNYSKFLNSKGVL